MEIIKEGYLPTLWKKVIICDFLYKDVNRVCGTVFEISKEDLQEEQFQNQDDLKTEYTYYTLCPTCRKKTEFPEFSL